MKIEKVIKKTLEEMLIKLGTDFQKVTIEEKEDNTYSVNIESADDTATLIGHHGETIYSLQHVLKVLCWARTKSKKEFNIVLDVENYRLRQEEKVINIAERKVDFVRKTGKAQSLPPMSPYFRRVVHLHLMQPEFEDVDTESLEEGDARHLIIKPAK